MKPYLGAMMTIRKIVASATLLCAFFGVDAVAQERVAVMGLSSPEGAAPAFELIAGLESRLEAREGQIMGHASALNRLSSARISYESAQVRGMITALNNAVEGWFEQRADAEDSLRIAIDAVSEQPILLALNSELSESYRSAVVTLSRDMVQKRRYDEGSAILKGLLEMFPAYIPSMTTVPPGTVDAIEAARSQLVALGSHLLVETHGNAEECNLNIHGLVTNVGVGKDIPVAVGRDYGLVITCSGVSTVPLLVSMKELTTLLPLGLELVNALLPLEQGAAPRLPSDEALKPALLQLVRTALGVHTLYVVAPGGEGVWAARIDSKSVRLATSSKNVEGLSQKLIKALDSGQFSHEVAVDLGAGWERPEEKSHLIEWILIGTGLALGVTGATLVGVGAARGDDVEACVGREPPCTLIDFEDAVEGPATFLAVGNGLWIAGAAVALTGVTILLVRMFSEDEGGDGLGDLGMGLVPGGATATWGMTW